MTRHVPLILTIAVPVLVVIAVAFWLAIGWVRRQSRQALGAKFAESAVRMKALGANLFGETSRGVIQTRGNGALALTDDELWFCLLAPRREISVPRQAITSVGLKNSHLGKTVFRPLLYVEYDTPEGPDSCAWLVPDPQRWVNAIEQPASVRGGFRIS